MKKEEMRTEKSGKKTMGMVMAAIIVASVFAMFAPISVGNTPVPSGKVAIYYLVPDNSSVPAGYYYTTVVQLRVNTTGPIRGGKVTLKFDRTCGNITGITFNTATWDDTVANKFNPLPDKTVITYGATSERSSGDYLIGNLTIHCNSSCCASNLSFISDTYISNNSGTYYMPADVSADNGTFICGKLLVINKTVKDPSTGNWVDGPLTLGPEWKGKDLIFKITVTSACENLSNVVVNDTMGPHLRYNNSASTAPYSNTTQTVNWTIGSLTAGSSWTVTFNATIVDYGTEDNTAKTSGTVDKIGGVGVEAEDSVTITANPPALIDVEKTVWSKPKGAPDYNSGTWVNAVQGAKIGEIYRFNCTIHNSGSYDLTNITFNDTLSPGLEYAGNATMVTPDGIKRNITMSGDGKDYEVDSFLQGPLTLKPSQRIFIEFDAKVVNYGNFSNVQWAKGKEPGGMWIYDHDNAWINTTKPDLKVTEITINYDAPGVGGKAVGPRPGPGVKTECNNISAVVEVGNGVEVVFPFNVTFTEKTLGELCTVRLNGLAAGGSVIVYCNCSAFRPLAGDIYNISVTVDSNKTGDLICGEIRESDETNNTMWNNGTAIWNGYKGDGWEGPDMNLTNGQCHEQGTINLTYSPGDSYYQSGWNTWNPYPYTANWTPDDLNIPPTDTYIKKARLYLYYHGEEYYQYKGINISPEQAIANLSLKFNGFDMTPVAKYSDRKGFGSWDYSSGYGVLVYDVTDELIATGNNTARLYNNNPDHKGVSIEGMVLAVVYNNPNEPERIIWIREGCDLLNSGYYGSPSNYYGVTPEEATTYVPFTGCEPIPTSEVVNAKLVTIAGTGNKGDDYNRMFFNGQLIGRGLWPNGYVPGTNIGINETEIPVSLIQPTNNTVAYQDNADMFAVDTVFLVLEKGKVVEIVPANVIVQPQDQFDIEVVVSGNDVYGVQYTIKYDPNVLRAESQVSGDFLSQDGNKTMVVVNKIDHATGTIEYAETRINNSSGVTGRGTVAKIQFTAIGEPGATTSINITAEVVDSHNRENKYEDTGTVTIYKNKPPVILNAGSKHLINNAQKKYESLAVLCVNVTDSGEKGYNISYIRWSFGDGQYGTTEGGLLCDPHSGVCCICKNHSYITWKWNLTTNSYEPLNASVTVTDDGCPEMSTTKYFDVMVYMAGDANGDGRVNILDAVWIGKHFGEKCDGTAATCCGHVWSSEEQSGADLNNDCEINILDAVIVGTMWGHTAW